MEQHALSNPDREVCGFVYADFYVPLRNIASDSRSFYADPSEIAFALARYGEPEAIFHTHPSGPNSPSQRDVYSSYYNNSTMIIGTWLDEEFVLREYGDF